MSVQEMCTGEETVVPGVLRGYRTWRIDRSGRLGSTAVPYPWRLSEQTADCVPPNAFLTPWGLPCPCSICQTGRRPHGSPARDCVCGFYGWYSPRDARLVEAPVFGAIEVSGRILLGTHGFRAERARVLGLVLPIEPWADPLRRACRASLVPTYGSRDELVEQLPPDDVSQLVAHTCEGDPNCFDAEMNVALRAAISNGWGATFSAAAQNLAQVAAAFSVPPDIASPDASSPSAAEAPAPKSAAERALAARRARNTGPRLRNPFTRRGRAS
jgi:hypothetical protein